MPVYEVRKIITPVDAEFPELNNVEGTGRALSGKIDRNVQGWDTGGTTAIGDKLQTPTGNLRAGYGLCCAMSTAERGEV